MFVLDLQFMIGDLEASKLSLAGEQATGLQAQSKLELPRLGHADERLALVLKLAALLA